MCGNGRRPKSHQAPGAREFSYLRLPYLADRHRYHVQTGSK
ncbi:MAG: hypothetical protein N838_31975 [Thiohalocapsa sp. PB-PSB1]|nr:MAG: hypothetical protein N838_31975 [Thiohalocapsa sp. PB-PSB1]